MNINYESPLRNQCMSIYELASVQFEGALKGYNDSGIEEIIGGIKKVVITGCGDSYFASVLAAPVFKKYCDKFGFTFMSKRCIDVARYYDFGQNNNNTLVIAISASGGPARIAESLLRAASKGCQTMALTNNIGSRAAESAKYKFIVNTPAFPNASPGLRNYMGSLMGLYVLAIKCGIAHGLAKDEDLKAFKDEMLRMNEEYNKLMPSYESYLQDLSDKWYQLKAIESVGNNHFNLAAAFTCAKFVEVSGTMTNTRTSNDFNQINMNYKNDDKIGTIFFVDEDDDNLDDMLKAVKNALSTKRQVLVISNYDIDVDCAKIVLPRAKKELQFVETLFEHLPGALIAAYCASAQESRYFRGGIWAEPDTNTIKSSEIVIL